MIAVSLRLAEVNPDPVPRATSQTQLGKGCCGAWNILKNWIRQLRKPRQPAKCQGLKQSGSHCLWSRCVFFVDFVNKNSKLFVLCFCRVSRLIESKSRAKHFFKTTCLHQMFADLQRQLQDVFGRLWTSDMLIVFDDVVLGGHIDTPKLQKTEACSHGLCDEPPGYFIEWHLGKARKEWQGLSWRKDQKIIVVSGKRWNSQLWKASWFFRVSLIFSLNSPRRSITHTQLLAASRAACDSQLEWCGTSNTSNIKRRSVWKYVVWLYVICRSLLFVEVKTFLKLILLSSCNNIHCRRCWFGASHSRGQCSLGCFYATLLSGGAGG